MNRYLVIRRVNLHVDTKVFRKDAIITIEDVGQDNIDRYLRRGYIKLVGEEYEKYLSNNEKEIDENNIPFYLPEEDFLTPEKVNALERPQLLEYAKYIGVTGFARNITTTNLQNLVNDFIRKAIVDNEDEDEKEDS